MRNKIFMYLFFFAVLLLLFQYMNQKSVYESMEKKIVSLERQQVQSDSIADALRDDNMDLTHFTLLHNDNAMSYFERIGYEASDVKNRVSEAIFEQNLNSEGNKLVPVAGVSNKMTINAVKFLNHRWIIADFTDGSFWGEVLIEYFVNEDDSLSLTPITSVVYVN